jgi:hypothetical protein
MAMCNEACEELSKHNVNKKKNYMMGQGNFRMLGSCAYHGLNP